MSLNTFLALALAATGLFDRSVQPVPDTTAYVALGDSVAAGIGSSLPRERGYPYLLGELFQQSTSQTVIVENLAVPGESAASFLGGNQIPNLSALTGELSEAGTDIEFVTLSLGGNELLQLQGASTDTRSASLSAFESDYPADLEAIRTLVGPDVEIYVATIYDPTGEDAAVQFSDAWWIDQFNAVIREQSNQAGITVVDLAAGIAPIAADATRYPVDVHPTNEGHLQIARTFWREIGVDREAPEIEVVSDMAANRFTPTIRFKVSPDTVSDSIHVETSGDSIAYPAVRTANDDFVVLIDASASRPESIRVVIHATDAAGNKSESSVDITFPIGR